MSSPEDVPINVMAEVAKDFLGPTVIGTFFNICLVSEHSIPRAGIAYFDNDPFIELIVAPVWSPAHAGAGILSTFSQVCRSCGSMRLVNPCSCFYCASDPRWLKVVVATLLLLETANSVITAAVGEPIVNRFSYGLLLKFT